MKIENLKVNGFGKLENKEINFSNSFSSLNSSLLDNISIFFLINNVSTSSGIQP